MVGQDALTDPEDHRPMNAHQIFKGRLVLSMEESREELGV